ncbi:MAG TPA: transglutaminase domain-containing protein, partial [Thermoanaerobaculia bacterium]|nr:transglutaminase domain-containing protein [Thermoanaerobaculia bacterium]
EEKAKAAGGKFSVRDDVLNKTWELELVRVHKDRLQALADGRYFACVDFKAADGTMVDVDFFLKKEGDKLVVNDTSVHKIDGKARYNYEEKDGVWVRVAEKS